MVKYASSSNRVPKFEGTSSPARAASNDDGVSLLPVERGVSDERHPCGATGNEREEQLFRAVFETTRDPMMIVDGEHRIVALNEAAEKLTGWRKDLALGQHCWDVYSCGSTETTGQSSYLCPLAGMEGVFGSPLELAFISKEAKRAKDFVSHIPLPSPVYYGDGCELIVIHATSTQEEGRPARQDIIAEASHELLSPLNLVRGYVSTLLELGETLAPRQRRQYLRAIEAHTARATKVIRDFLELPRLEAGRLGLTVEPTSLVGLVRAVVSSVQNQSHDHVIKLRSPSSMPVVNLDSGRFEQVLMNLLSNATKYSPDGGDIEVSIEEIRDQEEMVAIVGQEALAKPPCLIVAVRDSGVGIPEHELELVFEKFYRVDSKLTRGTSGVGIGLYISRVIVEAHGGSIWATSKVGEGSTFYISLPMSQSAGNQPRTRL